MPEDYSIPDAVEVASNEEFAQWVAKITAQNDRQGQQGGRVHRQGQQGGRVCRHRYVEGDRDRKDERCREKGRHEMGLRGETAI